MPFVDQHYAPSPDDAANVAASNESIAQAFFEHLRNKDIDSWIALWDDNGTYQIPYDDDTAVYKMQVDRDGTVTTIRGRENIAACFSVISRFVERAELTDVEVRQTLDPTVLYVEFKLAFLIAKTQFLYKNIGIGRMRIVDGKIRLFREYLDLARRKEGWAGVFF